ncbi:MAG: TolC family protein [Cyanobacteria bacterium]|nr:TolC family protein [Cyanobacteriota bacterium]
MNIFFRGRHEMLRTRIACSMTLMLLFAAAPSAQELPAVLSLGDAIQLAGRRNPTLAAAANEVEAAEGDRLQASRRLNPAITTTSEGFPMFDASRPSFMNGQDFTIRADQELELAGRRRLRTGSAATRVEIARSLQADQRRIVELAVQRAYLQVVLAKAERDVSRAALEDIDRMLTITRARFDQGEIAGGELRRLQVERLRFVDDQFATDLAFRNAKAALLAAMGYQDLTRDFDVSGLLTEVPAVTATLARVETTGALDRAALERQAMASRPDLLATRTEQQRADTETQLQRAIRTPNITLGGGYTRRTASNGVLFAVTVPLPVFNRNPGGIVRAEAERRRAANRATAAEIDVRLDVQQAVNAIEVNQARVQYIERETLGAAREARDAVMAAYQVGEAGLIDYLDAQRAFRDTLRIYNRALYERRLSDFEVAAAIGRPSVQP